MSTPHVLANATASGKLFEQQLPGGGTTTRGKDPSAGSSPRHEWRIFSSLSRDATLRFASCRKLLADPSNCRYGKPEKEANRTCLLKHSCKPACCCELPCLSSGIFLKPQPLQERTVKGVVMQMAAHEVWDIVSNMKQLVEREPDKAKQMFVSHPQVMMTRVSSPLFPARCPQVWLGNSPLVIGAGTSIVIWGTWLNIGEASVVVSLPRPDAWHMYYGITFGARAWAAQHSRLSAIFFLGADEGCGELTRGRSAVVCESLGALQRRLPPHRLPPFAAGRRSIAAHAGPPRDAEGRRCSVFASSSRTGCR